MDLASELLAMDEMKKRLEQFDDVAQKRILDWLTAVTKADWHRKMQGLQKDQTMSNQIWYP